MNIQDNDLWLQCWQDKHIEDFHLNTVNPLLLRFWPTLNLTKGSRVFVPLCGKSLDMIWLAKRGYEVTGVELSPIAVKAFFQENKLKATKKRIGNFILFSAGRIRILCGDYFGLKDSDLGRIDMVYDRASLTALPENTRKLYVSHLHKLLSGTTSIFLLTVENTTMGDFKKIPTIDIEIHALYSNAFDIDLVYCESALEIPTHLACDEKTHAQHKIYKLKSNQREN